jgi:hypothetical protein
LLGKTAIWVSEFNDLDHKKELQEKSSFQLSPQNINTRTIFLASRIIETKLVIFQLIYSLNPQKPTLLVQQKRPQFSTNN